MGKIGYGYGSEWQLFRMMGRHREYFDNLVKDELMRRKPINSESSIHWYDFHFDYSKDREWLRKDVFALNEIRVVHPEVLNKTN
jgi:hypothetical protein